MAVVSIKHAQAHAAFTANREGHSWKCPYIVTVDDARDGPFQIVEYFNHTINRGIDSPMAYGDDRDPFSYCDSIAPKRRRNSQTVWDVELSYSTPLTSDERKEQREWKDRNGNPTRDPLAWRGKFERTTAYIEVPVWKAWNVDALPIESDLFPSDTATYYRSANKLGPVVNSAGTVLDPPLMHQITEEVISITKNVDLWVPEYIDDHADHINGTPLQWAHATILDFDLIQRTFPAYTLRCSSLRSSFAEVSDSTGRFPYWKVTAEFRYRRRADKNNPIDGWLESVLDRGITRGATEGDPDGHGGNYTMAGDDHEDGVAHAEPVRGPGGGRIGEMVLLDGYGQPLSPSDPRAETGVYCRWRKHAISDFMPFPLNLFDWAPH